MLDHHTGFLTLSPTIYLHPGDSLQVVRMLLSGEETDLRAMGTDWQWLSIRNVQVVSQYYILQLGFYQDQLCRVSLVVSPIRFPAAVTWDGWAADAEWRRLAVLKQWVREQVGREGEFLWGSITASYDSRSAGSSITIEYKLCAT